LDVWAAFHDALVASDNCFGEPTVVAQIKLALKRTLVQHAFAQFILSGRLVAILPHLQQGFLDVEVTLVQNKQHAFIFPVLPPFSSASRCDDILRAVAPDA
jgi:hypothetical protein